MRYQWHGETMLTDLLSAIAAMGYGGLRAVYAINAGADDKKQRIGVLADVAVGAGSLIAKNYTASAAVHEALEGLGHAAFASLGQTLAASYKQVDSVPVWRPKKTVPASQSYYVYQEPQAYYSPQPSFAEASGNASILEI